VFTVGSLLPAIATLAAGVAFLVPRRARVKNAAPAVPETFAAAVTSALDATCSVNEVRDADRDPAVGEVALSDQEAAPVELNSERARRARPERKAPLTRLPLRPHTGTVAWPLLLEPSAGDCNRDARHRMLAEFARANGVADEAVLVAAYREEDAAGRALALRGLRRRTSGEARAIFEEAIRDGTDDERAAAVEALAACGPRESLMPALTDRVDAIAARAALGYVRSRERADYHLALAPFVDAARIDALLSLLAGYLE
jgi:hypothetical protein